MGIDCRITLPPQFFGGSLEYQDCGDSEVYEQPKRRDIHAEDDEEWNTLQTRKLAVKPITKADMKACVAKAAYK